MSEHEQEANVDYPRTLQPITEYQIPPMPTDVATRRLIGWFRRQFMKSEGGQPYVAESELVQASGATLESVAPPPSCGPLLRDLTAHFGALLSGHAGESRLHLLLLPPGDRNDVLGGWAKQQGLDVLPPPPRQQLLDNHGLSDLDAQQLWSDERSDASGVLVIPKLERWFLRHERGLSLVRQLLDGLDRSRRPLIIGCNTWAWDFLCKATQAKLVLPSPHTFQAFGADELHDWFQSLEEESHIQLRFRLSSSGVDLFADDAKKLNHFKGLAAESLGIPWVAWHRWRKSLRHKRESDRESEPANDVTAPEPTERTLWVTSLTSLQLPQDHFEEAALVLQALLIHGGLTSDELRAVVPIVGELRVVSALIQAGFVRRNDHVLQIVPTAYPEIRRELSAAGFPHPAL